MNRSCSRTRPSTGSASLKLLSMLAACGSAWTVSADPILQTHSTSLTSYVYTGSSRVQGVRPLAIQRGVHLDGSGRAGSVFGWAMAGNPFEPGTGGSCGSGKLGDIALETGAYAPMEVDAAFPAQVPWIIGRTYSQVQETSTPAHQDSDGYQGKNWFQMSQPELRLYDADSNPGTKGDADIIYLIYGADRYIEFDRTAANADTFRAVNGAAGVIELEAGSPDVYVYYDQQGNRTYFFGDDTASNVADWQLWKVVDPAGNTAYVGDAASAADAVTYGYNADGTIDVAYDSTSDGGRRFSYTYSTIDSVSRSLRSALKSRTVQTGVHRARSPRSPASATATTTPATTRTAQTERSSLSRCGRSSRRPTTTWIPASTRNGRPTTATTRRAGRTQRIVAAGSACSRWSSTPRGVATSTGTRRPPMAPQARSTKTSSVSRTRTSGLTPRHTSSTRRARLPGLEGVLQRRVRMLGRQQRHTHLHLRHQRVVLTRQRLRHGVEEPHGDPTAGLNLQDALLRRGRAAAQQHHHRRQPRRQLHGHVGDGGGAQRGRPGHGHLHPGGQ
jgi:hypothetical protein